MNVVSAVNIVKTGPRFAGRGPSKSKSDLVHFTRPAYRGPRPCFYDIYDIHDIRDIHDIHDGTPSTCAAAEATSFSARLANR